MADVAVDMETGRVRLDEIVAVQDCGLVINPKLAGSQVYGACIRSICGALVEERVMDQATGRMLNADIEYYKLAGINDIGEIVVHMDIAPETTNGASWDSVNRHPSGASHPSRTQSPTQPACGCAGTAHSPSCARRNCEEREERVMQAFNTQARPH